MKNVILFSLAVMAAYTHASDENSPELFYQACQTINTQVSGCIRNVFVKHFKYHENTPNNFCKDKSYIEIQNKQDKNCDITACMPEDGHYLIVDEDYTPWFFCSKHRNNVFQANIFDNSSGVSSETWEKLKDALIASFGKEADSTLTNQVQTNLEQSEKVKELEFESGWIKSLIVLYKAIN